MKEEATTPDVDLESADDFQRYSDLASEDEHTPANVIMGIACVDLAEYDCDWRDVKMERLQIYGPASPATHWKVDQLHIAQTGS